jgi:F-type H+-transporting ATPase subunit a
MEGHYTYLLHFTSDHNWQKLLTGIALGGALCIGGRALARRLVTAEGMESAVVPQSKLSLFGIADVLVGGFVSFHDSVLGREGRKHVPFTLSLFIFIFLANLIGLIPGMAATTATVWVNVAMAIVVFFYFNREGMRANGVVGYLKHFLGPVWWLAPLILVIEVLSTLMRILTLNLRLYWNITADHLVLGIFSDMVPFLVPCIFYGLGTFVAFMQAFVFTVLTMIYIMLATQHEEEGHH